MNIHLTAVEYFSPSIFPNSSGVAILGLVGADHVEETWSLAEFSDKDSYTANINKLVDANIDLIRKSMLRYDPKTLIDVERDVAFKVSFSLYSGWLQNLSKLRRSGDCILSYRNKILTLNLNFEWAELLSNYRYLLKVWFLRYRGDLYGKFKNIKMNIVIDVDLKDRKIFLKQLKIVDLGRPYVWIEGGITDEIFNLVIEAFTQIAEEVVMKEVTDLATLQVQSDIKELNQFLEQLGSKGFTFANVVNTAEKI